MTADDYDRSCVGSPNEPAIPQACADAKEQRANAIKPLQGDLAEKVLALLIRRCNEGPKGALTSTSRGAIGQACLGAIGIAMNGLPKTMPVGEFAKTRGGLVALGTRGCSLGSGEACSFIEQHGSKVDWSDLQSRRDAWERADVVSAEQGAADRAENARLQAEQKAQTDAWQEGYGNQARANLQQSQEGFRRQTEQIESIGRGGSTASPPSAPPTGTVSPRPSPEPSCPAGKKPGPDNSCVAEACTTPGAFRHPQSGHCVRNLYVSFIARHVDRSGKVFVVYTTPLADPYPEGSTFVAASPAVIERASGAIATYLRSKSFQVERMESTESLERAREGVDAAFDKAHERERARPTTPVRLVLIDPVSGTERRSFQIAPPKPTPKPGAERAH
jgi:hypothetical protein